MEYCLNTHYRSGAVRFALEGESLIVEREKTKTREAIPFDDIRELNLRRDMEADYSLHVKRNGGKTVVIPVRHFESLGKFQYRTAEYRAFIAALHQRVAERASTRFTVGSSTLYVFGWILAFMGGLLIAAVVIMLFTRGFPPRQVLYPIPVTIGVGVVLIRQGRSTDYDPQRLPPRFLPPL